MKPLEAYALGRELMDKHNLKDWEFTLDDSVRRFGCCKYRSKTISLSKKIVELNGVEAVRDTILHEIAHALTPYAGHGLGWKAMCRAIGAKDRRCYTSEEVVTPKPKFKAVCDRCKREFFRNRRPRKTHRNYISCAKCFRETGVIAPLRYRRNK